MRFGVGCTERAPDRMSEGDGLNSTCAHCCAIVSKIPNISGPPFSKVLKWRKEFLPRGCL